MRIYKLNLDVDNYESCFIEGTNVSKDCFDNLCTATSLDFEYETVRFRYSDKDDKKRGDVLHCWDFCGYLISIYKIARKLHSHKQPFCNRLLGQ